MTKEEIDILWHKAMRLSIEDGDQFTRYRFAELVAEAERAEVERLKLLCEEMLRELYVYRASEYLRDVTAAIRARSNK